MTRRITTSLAFFFLTLFPSLLAAQSGEPVDFRHDEVAWPAPREDRPPAMTKQEKKLLSVSADIKGPYKDFLMQRDTGLIRLLPRELSDQRKSRAGGAYYSFVRKAHGYDFGADISLEKGYFSVGFAGANYGLMVNLGDVQITDVTEKNDCVRYLAGYQAPRKESEARAEVEHARQGIKMGKWTYASRLPTVVNNTYVLRSIVYQRWDVLIAFRVVREESNGSEVILWRKVKEYPIPNLLKY